MHLTCSFVLNFYLFTLLRIIDPTKMQNDGMYPSEPPKMVLFSINIIAKLKSLVVKITKRKKTIYNGLENIGNENDNKRNEEDHENPCYP